MTSRAYQAASSLHINFFYENRESAGVAAESLDDVRRLLVKSSWRSCGIGSGRR